MFISNNLTKNQPKASRRVAYNTGRASAIYGVLVIHCTCVGVIFDGFFQLVNHSVSPEATSLVFSVFQRVPPIFVSREIQESVWWMRSIYSQYAIRFIKKLICWSGIVSHKVEKNREWMLQDLSVSILRDKEITYHHESNSLNLISMY